MLDLGLSQPSRHRGYEVVTAASSLRDGFVQCAFADPIYMMDVVLSLVNRRCAASGAVTGADTDRIYRKAGLSLCLCGCQIPDRPLCTRYRVLKMGAKPGAPCVGAVKVPEGLPGPCFPVPRAMRPQVALGSQCAQSLAI